MAKVIAKKNEITPRESNLLADLREMILGARVQVARAVDTVLVTLYRNVGRRIRQDILKEKRADYGETIVSALGRQLTWTHFRSLIYIEDPLKREFYAEMSRLENWSTRTLDKKIQSMLFERTALSRKPGKLIEQELKALREEDRLAPDLVFRDPYMLDFLGLKDTYAEKDLEAAILREMEAFILEIGVGITVDGDDYYLDLLFYRRLRRLVAIEPYACWIWRQSVSESHPIGRRRCPGNGSSASCTRRSSWHGNGLRCLRMNPGRRKER